MAIMIDIDTIATTASSIWMAMSQETEVLFAAIGLVSCICLILGPVAAMECGPILGPRD